MPSWINITLDTTPPTAEIFIPNISSYDSTETITVVANENLDTRHEFYAIDSAGTRHDFTFNLQADNKTFVGQVPFNQFSEGMIRFFFIVYDDVLNKSTIYVRNVNVGNAIKMTLDLSDEAMDSVLQDSVMEIILSDD